MKAYEQIELTPEQHAQAVQYREHESAETQQHWLNQKKIQVYVERHLERIEERGRSSRSMCYERATTVYRRRDQQPISQDDLAALSDRRVGQTNRASICPDLATIEFSWQCDSGG